MEGSDSFLNYTLIFIGCKSQTVHWNICKLVVVLQKVNTAFLSEINPNLCVRVLLDFNAKEEITVHMLSISFVFRNEPQYILCSFWKTISQSNKSNPLMYAIQSRGDTYYSSVTVLKIISKHLFSFLSRLHYLIAH